MPNKRKNKKSSQGKGNSATAAATASTQGAKNEAVPSQIPSKEKDSKFTNPSTGEIIKQLSVMPRKTKIFNGQSITYSVNLTKVAEEAMIKLMNCQMEGLDQAKYQQTITDAETYYKEVKKVLTADDNYLEAWVEFACNFAYHYPSSEADITDNTHHWDYLKAGIDAGDRLSKSAKPLNRVSNRLQATYLKRHELYLKRAKEFARQDDYYNAHGNFFAAYNDAKQVQILQTNTGVVTVTNIVDLIAYLLMQLGHYYIHQRHKEVLDYGYPQHEDKPIAWELAREFFDFGFQYYQLAAYYHKQASRLADRYIVHKLLLMQLLRELLIQDKENIINCLDTFFTMIENSSVTPNALVSMLDIQSIKKMREDLALLLDFLRNNTDTEIKQRMWKCRLAMVKLNILVKLSDTQGNFNLHIENTYKELLKCYQALGYPEPERQYLAKALMLLGNTKALGSPEEAEAIYNKAIALIKETDAHMDYLTAIQQLAHLYLFQGKLAKAEQIIQQACQQVQTWAKDYSDKMGFIHHPIIVALNNLYELTHALTNEYFMQANNKQLSIEMRLKNCQIAEKSINSFVQFLTEIMPKFTKDHVRGICLLWLGNAKEYHKKINEHWQELEKLYETIKKAQQNADELIKQEEEERKKFKQAILKRHVANKERFARQTHALFARSVLAEVSQVKDPDALPPLKNYQVKYQQAQASLTNQQWEEAKEQLRDCLNDEEGKQDQVFVAIVNNTLAHLLLTISHKQFHGAKIATLEYAYKLCEANIQLESRLLNANASLDINQIQMANEFVLRQLYDALTWAKTHANYYLEQMAEKKSWLIENDLWGPPHDPNKPKSEDSLLVKWYTQQGVPKLNKLLTFVTTSLKEEPCLNKQVAAIPAVTPCCSPALSCS